MSGLPSLVPLLIGSHHLRRKLLLRHLLKTLSLLPSSLSPLLGKVLSPLLGKVPAPTAILPSLKTKLKMGNRGTTNPTSLEFFFFFKKNYSLCNQPCEKSLS